jgi:hypothetical protein
MEEGKIYPIIGISASGSLMFATPFGGADYHGHRLRVTDGGQYGTADITLQNVRTNNSGILGSWTGVLTNAGVLPVGQCYAALQWYHNGQPFSARAQVIGPLNPGQPVTVNLSTPALSGGTHSFHLWSGENEIKPRII